MIDRKLVVAALVTNHHGEVLLTQRRDDQDHPLLWEFPGGKIEPGEAPEAALARELREELGVEVEACRPFMRLEHRYPDRHVGLSLWIVERFRGSPRPLDGQQLRWVAPQLLGGEDLLEADRPFVEALRDLAPP